MGYVDQEGNEIDPPNLDKYDLPDEADVQDDALDPGDHYEAVDDDVDVE